MVIKVRKYADGGKVETPPKPKPKETPKGDTIQAKKPESAADALKNTTARRMKELGLKDGGMVPKSKSGVKMPGPETRKMPPRKPMPSPQKFGGGGRVKSKTKHKR